MAIPIFPMNPQHVFLQQQQKTWRKPTSKKCLSLSIHIYIVYIYISRERDISCMLGPTVWEFPSCNRSFSWDVSSYSSPPAPNPAGTPNATFPEKIRDFLMHMVNNPKKTAFHANPKTFIFRSYFTHIWRCKTFIFHGLLGSKGYFLWGLAWAYPYIPVNLDVFPVRRYCWWMKIRNPAGETCRYYRWNIPNPI